jgi:diguanylate cyclase (GGDEF)-like protein
VTAVPRIFALAPDRIARHLARRRREKDVSRIEIHLDETLMEILAKANELVPSEAGSILLDDPVPKAALGGKGEQDLIFIAAFGDRAETLLGKSIPAGRGVAGHVYHSAQPYFTSAVDRDPHFYPAMDQLSGFRTRSVVAVPVVIGEAACGVLELVNRLPFGGFVAQDLKLLEIFARYISSSIQNALDANRARELVRRDDLTGLYNDRWFNHQLSEEVERAERLELPLSLLFIDLDHFKQVNDNYGHLAGSRTLTEVGSIIADIVPDVATAARYGGDEFVIILPSYDARQAREVAEQLRLRLVDTTLLATAGDKGEEALGIKGVVTCSIGVASYLEHVANRGTLERRKNALIRLADTAMYEAKQGGRNKCCVALPEGEVSIPLWIPMKGK